MLWGARGTVLACGGGAVRNQPWARARWTFAGAREKSKRCVCSVLALASPQRSLCDGLRPSAEDMPASSQNTAQPTLAAPTGLKALPGSVYTLLRTTGPQRSAGRYGAAPAPPFPLLGQAWSMGLQASGRSCRSSPLPFPYHTATPPPPDYPIPWASDSLPGFWGNLNGLTSWQVAPRLVSFWE